MAAKSDSKTDPSVCAWMVTGPNTISVRFLLPEPSKENPDTVATTYWKARAASGLSFTPVTEEQHQKRLNSYTVDKCQENKTHLDVTSLIKRLDPLVSGEGERFGWRQGVDDVLSSHEYRDPEIAHVSFEQLNELCGDTFGEGHPRDAEVVRIWKEAFSKPQAKTQDPKATASMS